MIAAALDRQAETEQELGDGYSDMGTEESMHRAYEHWGAARAYRDAAGQLRAAEAAQ